MRIRFILTLLLLIILLGASKYEIVKNISSIKFIAHTSLFSVTGKFDEWEIINLAPNNNFTDAKITLEVDTASLNTNKSKRDRHLRNEDFFNVKVHPKAKFTSSKIFKHSDNEITVIGNLALLGVSKAVQITLKVDKKVINKKLRYRFKGKTYLNRKDFNMNYQSKFPLPKIKNKVDLDIDISVDIPTN